MLHLILTHHVTAPSPPISPQTRGYKEKYGCLQSDSALVFGTSNWSQAHTPPIRGSHPSRSRNCQAGWQLAHPPFALQPLAESPFLGHLDIAHLLGPPLESKETFSPFPGAHLQVSSATLPEPQQGALCYNFCSCTPRPIPGIQLLVSNSQQPQ